MALRSKYLLAIRKGYKYMDLALEIQELSKHLDDNKKRLVIEIIKIFLPDDEVMPDDLHYIELAEQEYAQGETISHNDRDWK